jgi:hypothetical protein
MGDTDVDKFVQLAYSTDEWTVANTAEACATTSTRLSVTQTRALSRAELSWWSAGPVLRASTLTSFG